MLASPIFAPVVVSTATATGAGSAGHSARKFAASVPPSSSLTATHPAWPASSRKSPPSSSDPDPSSARSIAALALSVPRIKTRRGLPLALAAAMALATSPS